MTRKLMIWLTATTVLFWAAASVVGALVMREEYDEVFDSALEQTAQRLLPLVVEDLFHREATSESWRVSGSGSEDEEYVSYQVRDAKGAVLLKSHDAQLTPFGAPLRRGFSDTNTYRIYTEPAVSGTLFLQVAGRLDERREATRESAVSLLLPILLLIPLSLVTIWYIVTHSLRPLGEFSQEISSRNGSNLEPLTVEGLPIELEPIRLSVDRLLERVRNALVSEREFASNSAHELRTPIAGALAQTQRLIAELKRESDKSRARAIETSLLSLGRLAEKLLQLARADSGIGLSPKTVDAVTVIELIVDSFARQPAYSDRLRLTLRGEIATSGLISQVDVDALGIVLRNLIENALVHGSPGQPVDVTVSPDGTVRITNSGPALRHDQLAQLTGRFKRGSSTASGTGLGLAIANTLARQMGTKLILNSPAPGRDDGFEAAFSLPLSIDSR